MVTIHHFSGSEKQYAEAIPFPGRTFTLPETCPSCHARDCLIRWGTYPRLARTETAVYHIRIQRIRCKACGRTHSLLPDFLHPHRQYVTRLLQRAILLYLLLGLGWSQVEKQLPAYDSPARSTIREWVNAFAHGAGRLLLDLLIRQLTALDPLSELPDHPLRRTSPAFPIPKSAPPWDVRTSSGTSPSFSTPGSRSARPTFTLPPTR